MDEYEEDSVDDNASSSISMLAKYDIIDMLSIGESSITELLNKLCPVSDPLEKVAIAEELFKIGLMMINSKKIRNRNLFLKLFHYLPHPEFITWIDYLNIVTSEPLADIDSMDDDIVKRRRHAEIVIMLRESRSFIKLPESKEITGRIFVKTVTKLFNFLFDLDKKYYGTKDDPSMFDSVLYEYFGLDSFYVNLMLISDQPRIDMLDYLRIPERCKVALKQCVGKNRGYSLYRRNNTNLEYKWCHSVLNTATIIFITTRVNLTSDEMLKELDHLTTMLELDLRADKWEYVIRMTLWLLMDTPSTSPFRAFIETFLLERIPKMMRKYERNRYTLSEIEKCSVVILNEITEATWNLFQDRLIQEGKLLEKERVKMEKLEGSAKSFELITLSEMAKNAVREMEKVKEGDDLISRLSSFLDPSCIAFNCVLAHLSIDAGIQRKTKLIADLNRRMESPVEGMSGEERLRVFNATFSLLAHTYYTVGRLTLRKIVCGDEEGRENEKGVFYRWMRRFGRRDPTPNDDRDMENEGDEESEKRKERARGWITMLNSQCPLTEENTNYSEMFDVIPYLAKIFLDEQGKNTYDVTTSMQTLHKCPSLVLGLLMWLYCLEEGEGREGLVKSMYAAMKELKGADTVWDFLLPSSLSPLALEMMKGPKITDCVTTSSLIIAFRPTPLRYRHEIADYEMLKKGVIKSYKQGWMMPETIDLMESCNYAAKHKDWVNNFMNELFKLNVTDEMNRMGGAMMGAAMIDPLQSFRTICQKLSEIVLKEGEEATKEISPCRFIYQAKLLAQMMVMGKWAEMEAKKRLEKMRKSDYEVPAKRKKKEDEEEDEREIVEDVEDEEGMLAAHLYEMKETLKIIVETMMERCRRGVATNTTATISFILKELAALSVEQHDPECRDTNGPAVEMKMMIPIEMITSMIILEPNSLPFTAICAYVEDKEERIKFLCLARSRENINTIQGMYLPHSVNEIDGPVYMEADEWGTTMQRYRF